MAGLGWQRSEIQRKRVQDTQLAQSRALSEYSQQLIDQNRGLDALIAGIRAGIPLSSIRDLDAATYIQVVTVLKQAVDRVQADRFNEFQRLSGHRYPVQNITYSPDSQVFASFSSISSHNLSEEKKAFLWNQDGTLLKTLEHSDSVTSVSFNLDSQTLASSSWDKTVKIWKRDGSLLKSLEHSEPVYDVKFNSDGSLFVSASLTEVKLWNSDGSLIRTLKHRSESEVPATELDGVGITVEFSPDNRILASASHDGTIKLWSLDGSVLNTLKHDHVGEISFSPDSQIMASFSADGTIKLWSLDGSVLNTLKHDHVSEISFSPDSQIIASFSDDGIINLWSREGTLLHTLKHSAGVTAVSFSPDSQTLASSSWDKTVKIWSRDGSLLQTLEHDDRVTEITFSPNGQTLASGSWNGKVRLWNRSSISSLKILKHNYLVTDIIFSPDSQILASGNWKDWSFGERTMVSLWRRDGTLLQTLKHDARVTSVSFSPDSEILVSGSGDGKIKLWNRDGTLLQTLKNDARVTSVSFSPDSEILVSGSEDGKVKLWNRNGTLLQTLEHDDSVTSVSFSPDNQILASSSWSRSLENPNGLVKLWSRDGTLLKTLRHGNEVSYLSFSPDGHILASASASDGKGTVKLWSRDGTLLKTLEDVRSPLGISFSPDSKLFTFADPEGTISLLSSDGNLLKTTKHSNRIPGGLGETIYTSISFGYEGQIFASADGSGSSSEENQENIENTVKFWSGNGTLLKTISNNNSVISVSFSPDSQILALASKDNTVILWNLNLDDLLRLSCNWVSDYLKNSPDISESDRHLCDGIRTGNHTRKEQQQSSVGETSRRQYNNLPKSERSEPHQTPSRSTVSTLPSPESSSVTPTDVKVPKTATTPPLTEEAAVNLLREWLQEKQKILESPFDLQVLDRYTMGQYRKKTEESVNWLKNNNAYYRFGSAVVKPIGEFSVEGNQVTVAVRVAQDYILYRNNEQADSIKGTGEYRFTLQLENGQWKIDNSQKIN